MKRGQKKSMFESGILLQEIHTKVEDVNDFLVFRVSY